MSLLYQHGVLRARDHDPMMKYLWNFVYNEYNFFKKRSQPAEVFRIFLQPISESI